MEGSGVLHAIRNLGSNKLKERNNALDELTSTLKQSPDSIPVKSLGPVTELLIELLDSEHRKYNDILTNLTDTKLGKQTLCENRLSSIAYVLRLLIEKTCSRIKLKTLKLLLAVLPELMVKQQSKILLDPVSVHISFSILALVNCQLFQSKFSLHQWVSLVNTTCEYLKERFKTSLTDRSVSNLISILSRLIAMDTIGLYQVFLTVHHTILQYLKFSKRQILNTRLIISLIKHLILKTHCIDVHRSRFLIKETWRHVLEIDIANKESLEDELSLFDIYASELLKGQLPTMVGHEEFEEEPFEVSVIPLCREYILSRLSAYKTSTLSLEQMTFHLRSGTENRWFEFHHFQLRGSANPSGWLKLFGITKLLISYYDKLRCEQETGHILKRRKFEPNLAHLMRNSQSFNEFLIGGLESSSIEIKLLVLQLVAFYTSLVDLDTESSNSLKEAVFRNFEHEELLKWVCLALMPLISQNSSKFSSDDLNRLLKLGIPLLKQGDICSVMSVLLSTGIKYSSSPTTDETTINQIYDLFELSELNGPSLICSESLNFWQHIQNYGKEFSFRAGDTSIDRIIEWLKSKWNQIIDLSPDQNSLHFFIGWLAGRCNFEDMRDKVMEIGSHTVIYPYDLEYTCWTCTQEQREFLLLIKPQKIFSRETSGNEIASNIVCNKLSLHEILYRVLGLVESDSPLTPLSKFQWITQVLKLISYLAGNSAYVDCVLDFKNSVESVLTSLKFNDKVSFGEFFHLVLSLNISNMHHLILHELNIRQIMLDYGDVCFRERQKSQENEGEFDEMFEESNFNEDGNTTVDIANSHDHSGLGVAVEAFLYILDNDKNQDPSETLMTILDFLDQVERSDNLDGVEAIIVWMEGKHCSWNQSSLERFIQLLNGKILQTHHNTSNEGIYLLCSFLDASRRFWLVDVKNTLNDDSNDILDWVISRFDDNSFSGLMPITRLGRLLINMLCFHDLSRCAKGGKQKIFSSLTRCLKKLDKSILMNELPKISKYMCTLSHKNQDIIFSEIRTLLQIPQQSLEASAFYALGMYKLSLVSYSNLIASLNDMLNYTQYHHTRCYISQTLEKMISNLNMKNLRELFHFCRFDMLSYWLGILTAEDAITEKVWDLELFGFGDIPTFIKSYSVELLALCFSRKKMFPVLINQLKNITKKTEAQLFGDSFHLTYPLAFVSSGIGEEIFSISNSLLGLAPMHQSGRVIVYKWTLNFLDLGSLLEMDMLLCKRSNSSPHIRDLFDTDHSASRYQVPLHIPLCKGISILTSSFFHPSFTSGEVQYLICWILSDMENIVFAADRISCIRQLKCLLTLNYDVLAECNILPSLLSRLANFLRDPEFHGEVMGLIIFLLRVGYANNLPLADSLPSVYSSVFIHMQNHSKVINSAFKRLSDEMTTWNLPYFNTWKFCNEIVFGNSIEERVYESDELVNDKGCDSSRLLLLSLLFSQSKNFHHLNMKEPPSALSVSNLLQFEVPDHYLSNNFRMWSAYYLASFENSGEVHKPIISTESSPSCNYVEMIQHFGSLGYFFVKFFEYYEKYKGVLSSKTVFLCKSLISFILSEYRNDMHKTDPICDLYLEKYREYSISMETSIFTKIHHVPRNFSSMDEFVTNYYLDKAISHKHWLSQFVCSLIDCISLNIPQLRLFYPLVQTCSIFSDTSLPILFNLMLYFDHRKVTEWSTCMFSKIQYLAETFEPKKKVSSALQVISMLRSGHRLNEKFCALVYSTVPLPIVCETALKCNQVSFAYMIFEEFAMEDSTNIDTATLGNIYESIGDIDLISGMTMSPNVIGALQYVNKTKPKSWKTFLFNNANLDARFNDRSEVEQYSLLKSIENHGFYGLSTTFGKELRACETKESYKWALNLGNWFLPAPEYIDSKEKGLYFTLKNLIDDAVIPSQVLEDCMAHIFSSRPNFSSTQEWLNTISELSNLTRITRSLNSLEDITSNIKNLHESDSKRLEVLEFEDYKSNLQSRYLLLMLLSSKHHNDSLLGPSEIQTFAGIQLANFVKLATEHKSAQDALKNSILMDKLIKSDCGEDTGKFGPLVLEKLQLNVSAKALWECKDFKTPVLIMTDLLNGVYDGNNDRVNDLLDPLIAVTKDEVQSLLVKWTSESRIETASTIFEKYIETLTVTVKEHDARAKIFYILGNFLNTQLNKMRDNGQTEEWKKRCDRGAMESQALETIYKNSKIPEAERKDAKKHLTKVRLQLKSDMEILNSLLTQKVQFVWKSLYFYMNTLIFTNSHDDDVLDKFCGLWFEYDGDDSINVLLRKEVGIVPSWKFLPWVNQIASKLSTDNTEFQKTLQLTMKRLLFKLPYESVYSVLSIKLYSKYTTTFASGIAQRIKAVERILKDLEGYENGKYYNQYVVPLEEFCCKAVDFANMKLSPKMKDSKRIRFDSLDDGVYWLKRLATVRMPLPTTHVNISSSNDGKLPRPYIVSVKETAEVSSTGLSLPKIVTFRISDGSTRRLLMKGSNDDLRQDAIMEQVFRQVNKILKGDKQMRKLDLNIGTYEVIPLGPRAGIIEYVANSVSLHEILTILHKKDSVSFSQARNEMKKVQTKTNIERLATYEEIIKGIKPQLRNFFFDSFLEPKEWLDAKRSYTKGTAVISVVGHILGLGDRHLNNILLDCNSGRPIHIDLGIAFDQGRLLPIPEMVPFRLTRDIIDGFGVTGVEGLFRRSCERTYSVLQDNYEKVMHVLNILKWDPLYSWVMSPVKKHKHLLEEDTQVYDSIKMSFEENNKIGTVTREEENQQSYRALKGVEEKLINSGLSVEATVQELIQRASDPRNLSVIYMGWSPFY